MKELGKNIREKITLDTAMGGMIMLVGLGLLSGEINFDGKVAGLGLVTLGVIIARLQPTNEPLQKKN